MGSIGFIDWLKLLHERIHKALVVHGHGSCLVVDGSCLMPEARGAGLGALGTSGLGPGTLGPHVQPQWPLVGMSHDP